MSIEALKEARAQLGPDVSDQSTRLEHLLILKIKEQGQLQDALALARGSEERVSAAYGVDHPLTLHSRFLLASILHRINACSEAEALHRQVLSRREQLLGVSHPSTMESMHGLSLVLKATACSGSPKLHEAEALLRRVRALHGASNGAEPTVEALATDTSLASLLRKEGLPAQLAEAEHLLRFSLDKLVATQGALHPETLVAKNQLGQLLHDRGRQGGWLDEALPLLQDTLAGRLEVLGGDHPQTFNARSALSRLLKDMGRHEEARTVLRPEDVAKLKRFVGSTHRVSVAAAETLEELAAAYDEVASKAKMPHPPVPLLRQGRSKDLLKEEVAGEALRDELDALLRDLAAAHNGRRAEDRADLTGRAARAEVLTRAARRIRDPAYTLRAFHADMVTAFPELGLYLTARAERRTLREAPELLLVGQLLPDAGAAAGAAGPTAPARETTSGVSAVLEYRRTMNCLFAVFWLCRLQLDGVPGSEALDGQRGFCFGVDGETWVAHADAAALRAKGGESEAQAGKRAAFHDALDWAQLHQLMVDAGVLTTAADGSAAVAVERTVSMLALSAIHDVMKIPALLPAVLKKHAPYLGYEAGVTIEDHDIALGYVLEHDAEALPSFAALSAAQQRPIKFSQAKLGFNHGWLVQAEAPPGALFNSFKAILDEGALESADVAFYFAHWLTDLAGAEATPLRGSEKFACKFPASVLASFVKSFPLVQQLAHRGQTELMEEFLRAWWPAAFGAPPTGPLAIAEMRLVVQAQTAAGQEAVRGALAGLAPEDAEVLGAEMALTGVAGQAYAASPVRGGPAFLVYYSPAFVRQYCATRMPAALRILAEVYRAARKAYPLGEALGGGDAADDSVTVRVDQLKACAALDDIPAAHDDGCCWLLVAKSSKEALVERHPIAALPALSASTTVVVLDLWRNHLKPQPEDD